MEGGWCICCIRSESVHCNMCSLRVTGYPFLIEETYKPKRHTYRNTDTYSTYPPKKSVELKIIEIVDNENLDTWLINLGFRLHSFFLLSFENLYICWFIVPSKRERYKYFCKLWEYALTKESFTHVSYFFYIFLKEYVL